METPSEHGQRAVAALIGNASASNVLASVRKRLSDLSVADFAVVGSLHDVLIESNDLNEERQLCLMVAARHAYARLWDDVDAVIAINDAATGGGDDD